MDRIVIVLRLLPALIDAVKGIEAALPLSGMGAEKLKLITDVVAQVDAKIDIGLIEKVVNGIVAFFNKTGVFQKAG